MKILHVLYLLMKWTIRLTRLLTCNRRTSAVVERTKK